MKLRRKHRPGWDDASFLMRTDPEREKQPRLESENLPEIPFSFDWPAIRRAWAAIGVVANEGRVRIHVIELIEWLKK